MCAGNATLKVGGAQSLSIRLLVCKVYMISRLLQGCSAVFVVSKKFFYIYIKRLANHANSIAIYKLYIFEVSISIE